MELDIGINISLLVLEDYSKCTSNMNKSGSLADAFIRISSPENWLESFGNDSFYFQVFMVIFNMAGYGGGR